MFLSSEKSRLVIVLGGVMAAAFIFIAVVNYTASRNYIREEIVSSSLPLLRDTIYSEIHSDLLHPIHVSSVMANDTFLRDWALQGEKDTDAVIKYLRRIHEEYGFFSAFFVSTETGRYYHFKDVLKTVSRNDSHDGWYYSFLASGLSMRLDVDTDQASNNELTVFINNRVQGRDGRTIGVTGVGLRLSTLANIFANYRRMNGRNVYLVNRAGEVQVHSRTALVKNATLAELATPEVAEKVRGVRNYPMDFEFESPDGMVFLTARYIPEIDWILVVQQPEREAMVAARTNLLRTIVGGLLVTLVVLGTCIFAVNRYQRRLETQMVTDTLTGLANRRGLELRFSLLHSLLQRGGSSFSLAVLDLDGFKAINDEHGHLVGDRILQAVGDIARATFRETDVVARWGGDEFMLLIMGRADMASEVVRRFRIALAERAMTQVDGRDVHVGVSCGLTTVKATDTLDSAYWRADRAMYEAKRGHCETCEVLEA